MKGRRTKCEMEKILAVVLPSFIRNRNADGSSRKQNWRCPGPHGAGPSASECYDEELEEIRNGEGGMTGCSIYAGWRYERLNVKEPLSGKKRARTVYCVNGPVSGISGKK